MICWIKIFKFEPRRRNERKGIKENDKKNPFISLLCALRAFAVRLFRQPLPPAF